MTGASTNRYTRLMNEVIRANGRTKVLMLSATPINNRLTDLRNQIELITEGRDDYLEKTDGITSIDSVMRLAQKTLQSVEFSGTWTSHDPELRRVR